MLFGQVGAEVVQMSIFRAAKRPQTSITALPCFTMGMNNYGNILSPVLFLYIIYKFQLLQYTSYFNKKDFFPVYSHAYCRSPYQAALEEVYRPLFILWDTYQTAFIWQEFKSYILYLVNSVYMWWICSPISKCRKLYVLILWWCGHFWSPCLYFGYCWSSVLECYILSFKKHHWLCDANPA